MLDAEADGDTASNNRSDEPSERCDTRLDAEKETPFACRSVKADQRLEVRFHAAYAKCGKNIEEAEAPKAVREEQGEGHQRSCTQVECYEPDFVETVTQTCQCEPRHRRRYPLGR